MQNNFKELTNFPILLAPMVGLSHVAMRCALRPYYPQSAKIIWPTEMLNSRRLPDQILGETPETLKISNEENLCPQILGNQQDYITKSVIKLKQWGAKAIDINMGCPVKKALKHNYGVSLMGDLNYAKSVVEMAANASDLPVSVKLRSGHQNDLEFLLKFCKALQEAGAKWLCLHPRLAQQKRQGNADWTQIKYLKENINIPVIGNGDIQLYSDISEMFSSTGCDGVMIGRALTARPWLITQWALQKGYSLSAEQLAYIPKDRFHEASLYGQYVCSFINECYNWFSPKEAHKKTMFFVKVGSVWLNFGHAFSRKLQQYKDRDGKIEFTENFFKNDSLKFSQKTNLRY